MRTITHILLLPMILLISVPAIADERSGQGPAKVPAELRLNNSATLSTITDVQLTTAIVVDKVEVYIQPSEQAPAQK